MLYYCYYDTKYKQVIEKETKARQGNKTNRYRKQAQYTNYLIFHGRKSEITAA